MTNVEQTLATAMEQSAPRPALLGGYGDFASVGRDNVEALVKSSTILGQGLEEIGKSVAALTQAQVEASLANHQGVAGRGPELQAGPGNQNWPRPGFR